MQLPYLHLPWWFYSPQGLENVSKKSGHEWHRAFGRYSVQYPLDVVSVPQAVVSGQSARVPGTHDECAKLCIGAVRNCAGHSQCKECPNKFHYKSEPRNSKEQERHTLKRTKGEHESGSSTSTCGFIHGKPTGQVTHRSEFLNGTGLHRSG